jgi:hypothetical protein
MRSTPTRGPAAVSAWWLDQLRDHRYRPRAPGESPGANRHDHYVTRQLKPVADAILSFVHSDFQRLVDGQMELF